MSLSMCLSNKNYIKSLFEVPCNDVGKFAPKIIIKDAVADFFIVEGEQTHFYMMVMANHISS